MVIILISYDVYCGEQRGTNELKKYLRSRVEPEEATRPVSAPVFRQTGGTSGIVGGSGDGVDRFRIASTKTLEYWSAIIQSFVTSAACV